MLLNDLQVNATQFLIEGISDFANTSVNLEFEKQKKKKNFLPERNWLLNFSI